MNLPLSWLNDYMKLDVPVKEYCDKMTLSGSKVEGYEEIGKDISNVVTGKILTKEKHPNADTLWICKVDVGEDVRQIITGAQNIEVGDIIPVALHGAHLPGGIVIKTGKLRGEESQGMMCSHDELGLEFGDIPGCCENGILIFQEDYALGMDVKEIFDNAETVVEFEITSNRPDCLSVIGLARESAATFGVDFAVPKVFVKEEANEDINNLVEIKVEDKELCPRYTSRIVKNIKIEPSPRWMQKRLKAAGVRPINNIVDITNYVMLEYGQPMHAFDMRYIEGDKIIVRKAKEGEVIKTLDEQDRVLESDMLVICDAKKPIAVAGVMGGENSDIKEDTKTVLFESANFLSRSVRITAKKLGMRTEASARYEKGLDVEMLLPALNRACQLVEELGAGEVVKGIIDVDNCSHTPNVIKFRPDCICRFLGTEISTAKMIEILEKLEFHVDTKEMTVTPPSYRADVEGEADVAEEIARIYGYDKIPSTLMKGEANIGGRNYSQMMEEKIKDNIIAQGYYEIKTYSFTSPKSLDMINAPDELRKYVEISNPLGEDTSIMRTNTVSSMLEILARNNNHKNKNVRLFEIGKIYIPKALPITELPYEKKIVTLGGYGEMDFYDIKGVIEELFDSIGIKKYSFDTAPSTPYYHPGRTAEIFVNNKKVGIVGEVHPSVLDNYDISTATYIAEIELEAIIEAANNDHKYKPLTKFPSVSRDIAMIVDESIKVAQIDAIIRKCSGNLLEELTLFDVYQGEQIPQGKKSVAYSAIYRAEDRTLQDSDINNIFDNIVKQLSEKLGAQLR